MFVPVGAAMSGDSNPSRSAAVLRAVAVLILISVALAVFGAQSAAAEEQAAVGVQGKTPGNGGFSETIDGGGTLTEGIGTVNFVQMYESCNKFGQQCQSAKDREFEGTIECIDASVVEGGSEATIGGTLTRAVDDRYHRTLEGRYFHITVLDGSTPEVPDATSYLLQNETPGCATEFLPRFTLEYNGRSSPVTVTGAIAPQTRLPEFDTTTTESTPTRQTRPRIGFVSTVPRSTFQCRFDEEPFQSCSGSSARPPAALSEGPHTFEVFATDRAGHVDPTPAKASIEVDTTPPETTLEYGPPSLIDYDNPAFAFTTHEEGKLYSFLCSVDGAEAQECFPTFEPGPFADGKHTVTIRGRDAAGNVDPTPVKVTFTVDTTPPDTTITSSPTGPTKNTAPRIRFASSEPGSTYLCRFDEEPFGPCSAAASTVPPSPLADGPHEFEVDAIDKAGNVDPSPAKATFTVDTTAPEAFIVSAGPTPPSHGGSPEAPEGEGGGTSYRITLGSNDSEATFECRLDSEAFAPCSSPVTYEEISKGNHTFRVRAVDPAGNRQATPTVYKFKI
jgi:Bacterial Ig-like domain